MKRKNTLFVLTVFAVLAIFVAIPAAAQYKQINLVADQPGIYWTHGACCSCLKAGS
jgi:hypothetical protein